MTIDFGPGSVVRVERTERFVKVEGALLFVVDEGSGPPIFLLHAAIIDHRAWDDVSPLLVSAGYRVIRYDARGFGRSQTADVEFAGHRDLVAVMAGLGIERALLVGNSLGGGVALDAAIEEPAKVAGVVMVASSPGGFEGELTEVERRYEDEGTRLENEVPPDPAALADFDVRLWVDGPGQPAGRGGARATALVLEIDREQYSPGHVSGRRTRLAPPAVDRLAEVRCPVLAVTGEFDLGLYRQAAQVLVARCADARTTEVEGVAHLVGMERPEVLARLIAGFAAELPAW